MEHYVAQPDLTNQPFRNPDVELYTNSSYFVKNGVRYSGFAVVTDFSIPKSYPLPPNTSTQLAKLVVLTKAPKLSKKSESQHLYRF
jgi:hypothetical protein